VTGFQPPGAVDFQQTIPVRQLRATVEVHIHYSIEAANPPTGELTEVTRRLALDAVMPAVTRPFWPLVTAAFDKENTRTLAALRRYAEAQSAGPGLAG
jgi:hypothetical protein